jgi:hypothetical protein
MTAPIDPASLAGGIAQLMRLCQSDSIRQKCIAHAADFGWDGIAAQYEILFNSIVSDNAAEFL